jgi:uncharacterized membrane protein
MPFHEYMWRGDDAGWYNERISDVRVIYEKPETAPALMKKYNAQFLIAGQPERDRYRVNISSSSFDLVFSSGGTEIYQLKGE